MKKVLSVLITAALMLQLLAMFGAVSAEGSAAMTVTSASGTVGSTVTVDVGISNNPGFHALECQIEYDETLLELVSIEGKIGKAIPSEEELSLSQPEFVGTVESGIFIYMGVYYDQSEDSTLTQSEDPTPTLNLEGGKITGDITVATLKFKLLATGTADVMVTCEGSLYLDEEWNVYEFATNPATGTVTVTPPAASNIVVNCIGDIDYTVSGNVVTVDHEVACKVGYLDGTAYKAIAAIANGNGTYSFTAPSGVTEVVLVAKGDINGDDDVTLADIMAVARYLLLTSHPAYQELTAIQVFACDIDNNGSVILADNMTIIRSILLTTHPAYQELTW